MSCKCPLCGGEVEHHVHPTNPPQDHYRCLKCGRHKDVWQIPEPDYFAPFDVLETQKTGGDDGNIR